MGSNLPEINFVDTDTETIAKEMIADYEAKTNRTLFPGDPVRILLLYCAGVITQERVMINETAKMNVPRYAKGKYLDSLGELFKDVYRLPAANAKTTLRFYITAQQETAVLIPKGTRVSVGGEIIFETEEDAYVAIHELYADIKAACVIPGEIGNGFLPGQINQIIDVFPYFGSVSNTTESSGGANEESDEKFYNRMKESNESFSTAGPAQGYIYHAMSVSQQIADVTAKSERPGEVDIRILCKDGKLPGEEMIKLVRDALNADKIRPLTDLVTVSAPDTVGFDVNLKYFLPPDSFGTAAVVTAGIEAAVDKYISWQTEKMGRGINPSYLIHLVMQAGAKRVEVYSPVYTAVSESAAAVLGEKTVINGGVENE